MTSSVATPTDDELASALHGLVAAAFDVVARRPNAYTSSCRSEVVTIRSGDGRLCQLLVKYDRGRPDPFPSCRHGIDYCGRVYETVVEPLPLPHLRALGTIRVGPERTAAIVIEYLDDAFRVGDAPDGSGILAAAKWCGCFHRLTESGRDAAELAFLARYDAAYYGAWADRAVQFATAVGGHAPWIDRCARAFRRMADGLAASPTTVIHGEMGPQNVLWREGAIYPVDWESAAVGPGEIDLAALLHGWPAQTVERCITAYWNMRQTPCPADFRSRWDAATLYTALRWLPPPSGRADPLFNVAIERLRRTAAALGIR